MDKEKTKEKKQPASSIDHLLVSMRSVGPYFSINLFFLTVPGSHYADRWSKEARPDPTVVSFFAFLMAY